jgi:hypothetical protein
VSCRTSWVQKKSDALALARWEQAQVGCGWWRAKLAFSQPMFIIRNQLEQIDTAENTKPGIPQCAL